MTWSREHLHYLRRVHPSVGMYQRGSYYADFPLV